MVRDKAMLGDMFGNMSFDSSDEDDEEVVPDAEVETEVATLATNVGDNTLSEVGYRPQVGPAILVHQIRERGLSFQLWPAAAGMCFFLETAYGDALRGESVVELGAGTGMAGVMAARFGARVTLTDLPHVLPNLQSNVDLNVAEVEACGGSLSVVPLRWGVLEDVKVFPTPDLIIASDCVYYDKLFEPLMQTLKWLCGIGDESEKEGSVRPVVLLAHLRRWKKDGQFFRMAAKFFNVEVVHRHPLPENVRTGIVVYKFTLKLPSC